MGGILRFLAGMVAGVVGLTVVLLVGGIAYAAFLHRDHGAGLERAILTGRGRDLSRLGAEDIVLASPDLLIRQRCRGTCDDTPWTSSELVGVRVLDSRGRPLVERWNGLRRPPWARLAWWLGLGPGAARPERSS